MENITDTLNENRQGLEKFVQKLTSEKKYYSTFSIETIMGAELVLAEFKDNKIIGVAGLWRKIGISRPFAVIVKEFQGKGLGNKFEIATNNEAKLQHNFIMPIICSKNKIQVSMTSSLGFEHKILGRRGKLTYMIVA